MTNRRGTPSGALWRVQALITFACCTSLCGLEAEAAPVVPAVGTGSPAVDPVGYLSAFGYLPRPNPMSQAIISEESLSRAISQFQTFVGVNVTGKMDAQTAYWMSLPRCGNVDVIEPGTGGRTKRYVLYVNKLPKMDLTYKISKYSERLSNTYADQVIAAAFALWSDHTNLTFSPSGNEEADIDIRFERGDHGDGDPFDKVTLAHASHPGASSGNMVHFDDDDNWVPNTNNSKDLLRIATHEIGHVLGLDHSRVPAAIMFSYSRRTETVKLHKDDIAGIQALYSGSNRAEKIPEICEDPYIDTTFTSTEGNVYVFRGKWYWKLTKDQRPAAGYPKLIAETWTGLPSNIDFATTQEDGKTYFIKGSRYWCSVGEQMNKGYPKNVGDGVSGIASNMTQLEELIEGERTYLPLMWAIRCAAWNVPE